MVRESAYEGDQGDAEFTNLLNNPLGRAIRTSGNDPAVGPSNIEDTTQGLQDVIHKKG